MKNSSVIPLLEKWEIFTRENTQKDIYAFARWLLTKGQTEAVSPEVASGKNLENASRVAIQLTRLQRYLTLYIRPVVKVLGFTKEHEYNFLYQVGRMSRPNKNELSRENMVELSTGRDIIRRLISRKLILEKEDPEDKRASLLLLTPKGRKILEKSYVQIAESFTDFLGDLSSLEQKQLIQLLSKVNHYQAVKNNREILGYL
jgi:DNA-binding MarR family transcriptional regulator